MIRVVLPTHLWRLADIAREVEIQVEGTPTQGGAPTIGALLDALETRYPVLRGTIRDHTTKVRRPFVRYFACGKDWSLDSPETPLPEAIVTGAELFRIVGAMSGG